MEKYLKAYLISKSVDFGKTHNLEYLIKLCSEIDKDFEDIKVGDLSFYAVEVRYPDDFICRLWKKRKKVLISQEKLKILLRKN